jgi:transcription elongation GreA/GreB family factor
MSQSQVKERLLAHLIELYSTKIDSAKGGIEALRVDRDTASKSTAGDKHEVGRAMMQIEMDNQQAQLAGLQANLTQLQRIAIDRDKTEVGFGSLVYTDGGIYFMAIGLGRASLDDQTYFVISSASPIGELLMNKKVQDEVTFNGRTLIITSIS